MNTLPKDPVMLLSVVNTMLRDEFPSLKELCKAKDADMESLKARLLAINYSYDEEQNRFI